MNSQHRIRAFVRTCLSITGFALALTVWSWLLDRAFDQALSLFIVVGGVLVVLPVVWIGRAMLDAHPTVERALWVTTATHYAVMIPLGAAIIEALKVGRALPGWVIPLPVEVGWALMVISGTAGLLTVANLALRGLGAPFAIALSRRLAADWLYAWTRNPMVLSVLVFMVSVGLWLRSTLFVLWVVAILMPVMLVLLKVYEERELEIRFGASYLDYKARTPMLWPRKPKTKRGERMSEQEVSREELLARYVSMPDQLEAAVAGLSESDLDLARSADAWTIRQIVHHIVDADDITKVIIKAALGNPGCTYELEWYDPNNTWAKTLDYASRPIAPAMALLRASHQDIEQLLRQLSGAWERYVMSKRFRGLEETKITVGQLIHIQAGHAFHHIEQILTTRHVHGL